MAKVRIKETGEVMDFAPNSLVVVHRPDAPPACCELVYPISEVEIIPGESDSERIEFAKAAMQSFILRGRMANDRLAKRSFEIADAMIKQMRK